MILFPPLGPPSFSPLLIGEDAAVLLKTSRSFAIGYLSVPSSSGKMLLFVSGMLRGWYLSTFSPLLIGEDAAVSCAGGRT